ncbi:MAG: 5-formyltetrahydrofolate cyclo-ligase [Gammaproteobacteria bacterium]
MHLISPVPETDPKLMLRACLRERRIRLSAGEAAGAAEAASAWLTSSAEFRCAKRIAGYVAVRGELDPRLALETALAAGKEVFLPRVADDGALHFLPWRAQTPLQPNRFGIPEPVANETLRAPPPTLDLVIAPLLGFDRSGVRLGTGAGFYDRCFAFKLRSREMPPRLAGFAHAFQECATLVAADWDVPLDLVVTERGVTRFDPAGARES